MGNTWLRDRLLHEEILQFLQLARILCGEIVRLAEILGHVVQLPTRPPERRILHH